MGRILCPLERSQRRPVHQCSPPINKEANGLFKNPGPCYLCQTSMHIEPIGFDVFPSITMVNRHYFCWIIHPNLTAGWLNYCSYCLTIFLPPCLTILYMLWPSLWPSCSLTLTLSSQSTSLDYIYIICLFVSRILSNYCTSLATVHSLACRCSYTISSTSGSRSIPSLELEHNVFEGCTASPRDNFTKKVRRAILDRSLILTAVIIVPNSKVKQECPRSLRTTCFPSLQSLPLQQSQDIQWDNILLKPDKFEYTYSRTEIRIRYDVFNRKT